MGVPMGSQNVSKQTISLHYRAFILLLFMAFCIALRLSAQTANTGALSGLVTDPSAAAVVGATVKVTEASTGYTQTVRTNSRGQYRATLLPPGTYTVQVTQPGFKVSSATDVQVIVAEITVQSVKLSLGEVSEKCHRCLRD